jgi:predicted nucleic acid-binding protein
VPHAIDTCALLNLSNGQALELAASIPGIQLVVGTAVLAEAQSIAEELTQLIEAGQIEPLDENAIPAEGFSNLQERFDLGDGETECIAAAVHAGYNIVCDDRAARQAAVVLVGEARVTGSIGLLRQCVAHKLMSADAAYGAYERMKLLGGFLPELTREEMFP